MEFVTVIHCMSHARRRQSFHIGIKICFRLFTVYSAGIQRLRIHLIAKVSHDDIVRTKRPDHSIPGLDLQASVTQEIEKLVGFGLLVKYWLVS